MVSKKEPRAGTKLINRSYRFRPKTDERIRKLLEILQRDVGEQIDSYTDVIEFVVMEAAKKYKVKETA